jgi:DNA uptake protein ComE-like DNA-binding protein
MIDEERKININTASPDILRRLPNMTEEAVNSIIDWRDADNAG